MIGADELDAAGASAAEVAAYVEGSYAPSELKLTVTDGQAELLADAAVRCLDRGVLLDRLGLTPGNVHDALGRPKEGVADIDSILGCAAAAIDDALIEHALSQRVLLGPDALTTNAGTALIDSQFEAIRQCVDPGA